MQSCPNCKKPLRFSHSLTVLNPWYFNCPYCKAYISVNHSKFWVLTSLAIFFVIFSFLLILIVTLFGVMLGFGAFLFVSAILLALSRLLWHRMRLIRIAKKKK